METRQLTPREAANPMIVEAVARYEQRRAEIIAPAGRTALDGTETIATPPPEPIE